MGTHQGLSLGNHQASPVLSPGRQQLLTAPPDGGPGVGAASCPKSHCGCTCQPALNTETIVRVSQPPPAPVFSASPSAHQPPPTLADSRTLTCVPSTCQRLGLPTSAHLLCQGAPSLRPASLAPLEVPFTHPSSSLGQAKPRVTAFPSPLVSTYSVSGLDSVPPSTLFQACPATATPGPMSLGQCQLPGWSRHSHLFLLSPSPYVRRGGKQSWLPCWGCYVETGCELGWAPPIQVPCR